MRASENALANSARQSAGEPLAFFRREFMAAAHYIAAFAALSTRPVISYNPYMSEIHKPLAPDHRLDIATGIILSLVTCGLYNIYWNYREFEAMNELLGKEEYRFWTWALLSLVTCGIYHVYYEYKMGSDICAYMKSKGLEVNANLPMLGLALSAFGLTIVADAVYQHELNRLVREENRYV